MKYGKYVIFALLLSSTGLIQSCQKEELNEVAQPSFDKQKIDSKDLERLEIDFSKILSKAVASNRELREFIKNEAKKQFDKDDEILYQMVKDKTVTNSLTLHDYLKSFSDSPEEFDKLEKSLPLLTILVPTLPSGFSPENWDINSEIPLVAISKKDSKIVNFYNKNEEETSLPSYEIPGFPVLVVKQSERVFLKEKNISQRSSSTSSENYIEAYQNQDFEFGFKSKSFDGMHRVQNRETVAESGVPGTAGIDFRITDAYQYHGSSGWQRDWVYYSIISDSDPYFNKGAFLDTYRETIRTIKFNSNTLYTISDQTGDPQRIGNTRNWTDGRFEFKIIVITDASDDGSPYDKLFGASLSDLYDITYSRSGSNYNISSITPKEYRIEVDLFPWDLQRYGNEWKLVFYEIDPGQTEDRSETNRSTIATNFEASASGDIKLVKVGTKFGGSVTTENIKTVTTKTVRESDYLGEVRVRFDQPIILSDEWKRATPNGLMMHYYKTYENSTGGTYGTLSVSIEPVKYK